MGEARKGVPLPHSCCAGPTLASDPASPTRTYEVEGEGEGEGEDGVEGGVRVE